MRVELTLPGADGAGRNFLTWTPVEARARLLDPSGVAPVTVTLRNGAVAGRVRFATTRTHLGTATLPITLPLSGAPVRFFVAGEFGRASTALDDVVIEALGSGNLGVLGTKRVTVRVRKNAQTYLPAERDRFLAALATLNGGGTGRFRDFRDIHVTAADAEQHGNVGFLPWHRAFILDLERELQAIDPSIALPYWRFDQPAPNLFTRQFMGVSDAVGRVQFAAGHPLGSWRTDNQLGILRRPAFVTSQAPQLLSETQTIALGGAAPTAVYSQFAQMEGNPHGWAHTSFQGGFIRSSNTAPRDPLFFMLHANVDRLWAKWQWIHRRTNSTDPGAFAPAVPNRIGHRLGDTMWPWNGSTILPRPATAPGGSFPASASTARPGSSPTVRLMIDFQAVAGGDALGFAYDDVPFEV